MLQAIEAFRELRRTMPLQYIVSFLLVTLEEGKGVSDYATEASVSLSVMSRHLLDIGDRTRHMADGFGLITQRPDPLNLRQHQAMLTPKGGETSCAKSSARSRGEAEVFHRVI